jgi:putative cell wall-binding protein
MSDSSKRRPLALTATLATSVAAAAGMVAPAAHATTASPNGIANLTLSAFGETGTSSTETGTVGGTHYAVSINAKVQDLAWAPTGARAAWIDPTDNAVMAGIPGGAAQMIAPAAANGVLRSHPTWAAGGSQVIWSEKNPQANGGFATLKWAYGDGLQPDQNGAPAVHDFSVVPNADLTHPDVVGSTLVYGFQAPGQSPQIHGWDLSRAGTAPYTITGVGWDPSLSPDGSTVAFVNLARSVPNAAPQSTLFTVPAADPHGTLAAPRQVGNGSMAPLGNPAWTPDGASLVVGIGFGPGADTASIPAAGGGYTALNPNAKSPGVPAFQPNVRDHVTRIAGTDRLGTAIKASQSHWASAGKPGAHANAVVLSRSDQFADALGGSALAAKVGGPLLLTQTSGLNPAVAAEIQRVLGPGDGNKTVYVLGGVQALSPNVASALAGLHYKVQRLAGEDRFSTAVAIANQITGTGGSPDYVLLATGEGFADPLSAGAAAGSINAHDGKNAVVLLTNNTVMPAATASYLEPLLARTNLNSNGSKPANFIELDTIGGQAEKAAGSHWIPVGYQTGSYFAMTGHDRYETSYLVARYFFGSANAVGLATGMNWADALSGGAEMGTENGPLLLVSPTAGVPGLTAQWLNQNAGQFNRTEIFGGTQAVPGSVDKVVGGLVAGIGGVDYPSNPAA